MPDTDTDAPPAEVRAAIDAAHTMVDDLCARRRDWVMHVPADANRDPDLVISRALTLAEVMLDRHEAGASDEPCPEGVAPNPAQLWRKLLDAAPERRLATLEGLTASAEDADRCRARGHDWLRHELSALTATHAGLVARVAEVRGLLFRVRSALAITTNSERRREELLGDAFDLLQAALDKTTPAQEEPR
jgi:hypothetical protein